ncbi:MAG TPA: polymer-forming cytoskeletal protein [Syntrophorhabdaceae bacterium]|nr:polymer-forming cytoskeletal protein [Syntrophorhabdaceae bacterium]
MILKKKQTPLETLIGPDSTIRGELTTKGMLRVDGVIEGNVAADSLVVGKTGAVKGDITVRDIEVNGSIEGNINAHEFVEIRPEGAVEGDIHTTKLTVSEGAFFAGHSYMRKHDEAREESETGDEKKVERIF